MVRMVKKLAEGADKQTNKVAFNVFIGQTKIIVMVHQ